MKTQKQPSNNESQSSPEATSSRKPPVKNPLELLAKAIQKDRAQPSGDDDNAEVRDDGDDVGGEQPAAKKPKPKKSKAPKNLDAVAEVLGLELEELYKVEIPAKAKGAKPYTLGALKDLAADDGGFQVRKLRLDQDRATFEAERIASQAELNAMLQHMPADAIKPEQLQKLRNTLDAQRSKERARTLEVIPEWHDEAVRTAELKSMLDFARAEYGLPESYLITHMDHRLVRMMRDAWKNATTIRKALGEVTEEKPSTPPKSTATPNTAKRQPSPARNGRTQSAVGRFMDTIQKAAQTRQ